MDKLKPCPFCACADNDGDIEKYLFSKWYDTFWNREHVYVTICNHQILSVLAGDKEIVGLKINYCPICGREFKESVN